MRIYYKIMFVFIFFLITSCYFNNQYLNLESDKRDAEKVTNQFYALLKSKDYEGTVSLFSKKFFAVSSKEKLFKIYSMTANKLGELKNTKIEDWKTRRVVGSNPISEYAFLYKTTYTNFTAKEDIRLLKEPDGHIRIVGYHINSDAFLNN